MSRFLFVRRFGVILFVVLALAMSRVSFVRATGGPALTVNASAGLRHPISSYIYGMNFGNGNAALATELNMPVDRWGGDYTSRFNWQLDSANRAQSYFFENTANNTPNPALLPDGSETDLFFEADKQLGAKTVLTMPMLGWTSGSRTYSCSYSVAKYGAQYAVAPNDSNCGDGLLPDGVTHVNNDPTDTSVQVGITFYQQWMNYLVNKYGTASNGGVAFYNTDNEPELWNYSDIDVHPIGISYSDLYNLTTQFAPMIKTVDPSAQILGPDISMWDAYYDSPLDLQNGNTNDRDAHGGVPYLKWYLQQMHAYEQAHGSRIIDYLDIHFYPQADGVVNNQSDSPAAQALRLRSTRALWDPTYVDESWINHPVDLIPTMRNWINTDYPGTKLAISEYSFGQESQLDGGLAQADVLGILGRERVDMAMHWDTLQSSDPAAYAFRVYRNYDGAHSTFGDSAVSTSSADQGQLAVYGAVRTSDGALTLVMVNKTTTDLTSTLTLSNFSPGATAQVYTYSAANLGAIVRQADQAVNANGFTATYPAYSITLVVIPAGTASSGHIDTIGIYRNGTFNLRLHNSTGYADLSPAFNPGGGSAAYPVVGDWAGIGYDTIGVSNRNNGLFSLCNANDTATCANASNVTQLVLGNANDMPLSGRWTINATHVGVGVFRPSNGLIYLKTQLATGYADDTMVLGIPGDVGLAGDWNGKGFDSPGVYRPSNITFYLSNQVCNCSVYGNYAIQYGVGGDAPVVGDWIAQGHDGVGLFRQSNGYTYLRNTLTTGYADITFVYGIAGDIPVAGHWQLTYPPGPIQVNHPGAGSGTGD
jgi:hypothetical protein